MTKIVHINGKTYRAAEMTFNNVCRMEEMDAPVTLGQKVSFSLIRGYAALCMNTSKENAGEELEKHVLNGGSMDELYEAMAEAIDTSDFFRKMSEDKEQDVAAVETETQNPQ